MQGLTDPNWEIRFNALKKIRLTSDIVSLVRNLALSDESDQVRALACSKLTQVDPSVLNSELSTFLAKIVLDCSSPDKVRKSAYWALEHLYPLNNYENTDSSEQSVNEEIRIAKTIVSRINRTVSFIFPDDVNWNFVNSFLGENGNRTMR